ncbi:enoyl-CoA hydratase/isomerase family protein [Neptunitalea lumnitzerae]|uniref:Enoyl-CoA hydratase n=1 Tax=Neptunitalea lumnitzerae TaxID=2965509 RepID=A0ABQ5MHF0_9FLAO|nr:enoyl-CoA hydratase/isomerase family protein [Neptunitalea sp. Y10]GLB48731.1 enoyl-CoA hydratase [Neptunitalea sp. Y10]
MTQGTITTVVTNKIATITFGHPASNSFPSAMLKELTKAIEKVSNDKTITALVLQSAGEKAFCAGASFDELLEIKNMEEGIAFFSGFANVLNAMRSCTKLIIGRVQGKTVGGGVGLVAACDYVMATESAQIKLSEFSIGIGPFVIAPAVERKIGKTALADLTLNAQDWKSAQWALKKGLYTQVFESIKDVDTALLQLTDKLTTYNPAALRAMKHTLWEGTENWEELLFDNAEISGRLVLSPFTKEALASFKNKK